jgi:hypothetical protein
MKNTRSLSLLLLCVLGVYSSTIDLSSSLTSHSENFDSLANTGSTTWTQDSTLGTKKNIIIIVTV